MSNNKKNSNSGSRSSKSTNSRGKKYSPRNEKSTAAITTDETAKVAGSSRSDAYDAIRSNDISWWNNSPMYSDAVRVPFNRLYGAPIKVEDYLPMDGDVYSFNGSNEAFPGIMTLYFVPTVGATTNGSNAPVNRAFTSLYGDIYSKTTGAMQFQQADLALFMTSLSSIAMLIAHVKRALGVSQMYSGLNYYYPVGLLSALDVDPYEVIGHQDELRMHLNDSILSFNNLKVPDFMSIYKRHYSMCHNVYADEDDVTSQLYAFVPSHVYKYLDAVSPTEVGILDLVEVPKTIRGVLDLIQELLGAWRNSSDLGLISGSIQRAFSDAQLISLDYVVSGDLILPVVDRNINWQMGNADVVNVDLTTFDVTQDVVANCLRFEPHYATTMSKSDKYVLMQPNKILNSFDGDTSDEFIMEATRLMVHPISTEVSNTSLPWCNTEILTHMRMTYRTVDPAHGDVIYANTELYNSTLEINLDEGSADEIGIITKHAKFKYAPRLHLVTSHFDEVLSSSMLTYEGFVNDVYKYTTIDAHTLAGLTEVALQSVYQTNVALRI